MSDEPATFADELGKFSEICGSLARLATNKWASSVSVSPGFCFDEKPKNRHVVTLPCRVTVPGELVRIYVDVSDIGAPLAFLATTIRDHLGPFIEGVGEVRVRETPEGLVIMRLLSVTDGVLSTPPNHPLQPRDERYHTASAGAPFARNIAEGSNSAIMTSDMPDVLYTVGFDGSASLYAVNSRTGKTATYRRKPATRCERS